MQWTRVFCVIVSQLMLYIMVGPATPSVHIKHDFFPAKTQCRSPLHQPSTLLSSNISACSTPAPATRDHFKLYPSTLSELRLCSEHPRFVTCTVHGDAVHVLGDGPDRLWLRYDLGQQDVGGVLDSLLTLLQERQGEGRELLDWECEDWVGAGYPCRMWEHRVEGEGGLDFGADDLWYIEPFPSAEARLL
jgi:hypothetical protein